MKTCPYCAEQIQDAAIVCRFCNRSLTDGAVAPPVAAGATAPPRAPSPGVAAVLSFFIPGLGQIYKGSVGAGIAWLIFTVLSYTLFIVPGILIHIFCIVSALSSPVTPNPSADTHTPAVSPEQLAVRRRANNRTFVAFCGVVGLVLAGVAYFGPAKQRQAAEPIAVEAAMTPTPRPPAPFAVGAKVKMTGFDAATRRVEVRDINVWSTPQRVARVCQVRHGAAATVVKTEYVADESRWYVEISSATCRGWVPHTFVEGA